jgi:hypothetical protein
MKFVAFLKWNNPSYKKEMSFQWHLKRIKTPSGAYIATPTIDALGS